MDRAELIDYLGNVLNIRQGSAEELLDAVVDVVKKEVPVWTFSAKLRPEPPQLIQGYTAEQWQEIIDGGYLCEFTDNESFGNPESVNVNCLEFRDDEGNHLPFKNVNSSSYRHCRPAQIKGVMRPIFVAASDKYSLCHFFDVHGILLFSGSWESQGGLAVITEQVKALKAATKYIEV